MKVVGLVGQSGTGKTTIAEHLQRRGAGRIDGDDIAHEVLRVDEGVRRAIRDRFGPRVLVDDEIDRSVLGEIVFSDPAELEVLNGIVHPAIIRVLTERLEAFEKGGADLVVIDAALLLEVPLPFDIDLMIALRCRRAEQTRRLRAKSGASEKEIGARLDSQAHIEKSFGRADVVVNTERPKADLLSEIDRIIKALLDHGPS
jgi:dephospho-CoA kinase